MNRISRFVSSFLSLSLILAAPGLAPYQAAAQTMSARVVVPVGQLGAAGASINGLGGSRSVLPSASLQAGLVPSLTPSALRAEGFPVVSAAAIAAAPIESVAAARANAPAPVALKAAITPASPSALRAEGFPVISALQTGANALSAAAKTGAADAPRVALDGLFEGSVSKPEALAVGVRFAPSDAPRLEPSDADGSRTQGPSEPQAPKPASSLKRTLSVGLLAAVLPIVFTMGSIAIAQAFGYHLHPNYSGPSGTATTSVLQAVAIWVGAAVMAPISEEAIFRAGLQGRLAKLAAKLKLGAFVVPAVVTSLIFVALHETSDPLLFFTRFVHAMVLSYAYQKEGLLASMAAHAFFNGLLALSIVLTALHLPVLGIAVLPLAAWFSFKAFRFLKGQKPDVASGAVVPMKMTAGMAFLFAALLMLGYLFIMPNIFWPVGAVALFIAGMRLKNKA